MDPPYTVTIPAFDPAEDAFPNALAHAVSSAIVDANRRADAVYCTVAHLGVNPDGTTYPVPCPDADRFARTLGYAGADR